MMEIRPDDSIQPEEVTTPAAVTTSAGPSRSGRIAALLTRLAWVVTIGSLAAGLLAPLLTNFNPTHAKPAERLMNWGEDGHVLGTDQIGRDILTRLLFGARLAWIVGLSVAALAVLLGGLLGLLAGYRGGWVDAVVTRLVDALLAFPPLLLALVAAAVWGPSTRTAIFALGVVYTPLVARVSRAAILGERRLDYVSASRGLGNTELRTVIRHVIPNVIGPLLVVASVVFSRAVIVEASLSFLGAGTQAPNPNWGVMIADSRKLVLTRPSLVIVPAVVLSVTLLAVNVASDAMADRFDPGVSHARRQRKGR